MSIFKSKTAVTETTTQRREYSFKTQSAKVIVTEEAGVVHVEIEPMGIERRVQNPICVKSSADDLIDMGQILAGIGEALKQGKK
jgi:hypothetical protein